MMPQHGWQYEASGMAVSKIMAEADVALYFLESTRDKWVTISKIAVPLKVGAAMTTEIAGICVLTSILDLILCKCLSVQNINQRINRIRNN